MSTTTPPAKPDRAAIVRTFQMIVGNGNVTELRALEACAAGDRYAGTYFGFFDDAEKFADAAMSFTAAKGIYLVLNPVDPALLARAANRIKRAGKGDGTKDHNIIRRRWLPIDIDAIRPEGISSTEQEREAALHRAGEVFQFVHDEWGWGDPIEATSGNGAHLLYPIDSPTDDGGAVQRLLNTLAAKFNDHVCKVDVSVFNPARIWRCYGTIAAKGDHVPTRPHRLSSITTAPRELEVSCA